MANTKNKQCNLPVFIDPNQDFSRWRNAVLKHTYPYIDTQKLAEASLHFHLHYRNFLCFIGNEILSHKHKMNKVCQLNIGLSGFHFCNCFAQDRPKEATKYCVFLVTLDNEYAGFFEFEPLELLNTIRYFENNFEPIEK